jgi:hypothetical protein
MTGVQNSNTDDQEKRKMFLKIEKRMKQLMYLENIYTIASKNCRKLYNTALPLFFSVSPFFKTIPRLYLSGNFFTVVVTGRHDTNIEGFLYCMF